MQTFEQFLAEAAGKGELVNTLFEERLFALVGTLHKITEVLNAEHIPHELIGGLAVLIHVEAVSPEHSVLTRDVDLMMRRIDLDRLKEVAARSGFLSRPAAGVDMLIPGSMANAKNAIHLIFSGEKVRPNYVASTPAIAPEKIQVHGKEISIISVGDLLTMKLTSFRDKDRVHVRSLDAAGLISPEIVNALLPDLQARLQHVRETE